MCEYNRPFPVRHHPDDHRPPRPPAPRVLPWSPPADAARAELLDQAIEEAAANAWDVHTWPRGDWVGIEFRPGAGPTVLVWEHA